MIKQKFKIENNNNKMYASRYAGQFPRMNDESLNLKGSLIGNESSSGR